MKNHANFLHPFLFLLLLLSTFVYNDASNVITCQMALPLEQLVYLLIGLVLFQFGLNVYLYKIRNSKVVEKEDEMGEEIHDWKHSYYRVREELHETQVREQSLMKQIDVLKKTISQLENANASLLEQKDSFMAVKQQLQELRDQKKKMEIKAIKMEGTAADSIQDYLKLIKSYDETAEQQTGTIDVLLEKADNIMKLAQEVSILIKKKEGLALNKEDLAIKSIIDEVYAENLGYADKKEIRLINNATLHTPKVNCDRQKMKEAIDQLVNNAIKFAPPNKQVQIKTYFTDQKVTVEVKDTGVGIPQIEQDKLFQKGVTLSPKPTGKEKALGYGLFTVKEIMEAHEGKVKVSSKTGRGSSFFLEIPRSEESEM